MKRIFSDSEYFSPLGTKASVVAGLVTLSLSPNTNSGDEETVLTYSASSTETHIEQTPTHFQQKEFSKNYIAGSANSPSASFGFEDQNRVTAAEDWGLMAEIEELRELGNNWNGYGAPPIPDDVISLAREVATRPEIAERTPSVFPTGRETVQFEFSNGRGDEAELEIFSRNHANLLVMPNSGDIFYEEEASLDQSISLLDELLS